MQTNTTRRGFLRDAALAILAAGLAPAAPAQGTLYKRIDWATFTQGPDYSSFMDAIRKMRANTDGADKRSWQYWANVHQNYCPHGIRYFLAWHRGFITLFERQLREVSGNPVLALPYWSYYDDPAIPAELMEPASWNPLYTSRVNSNVSQALSLNAFSGDLINFQRGLSNAFEPVLESLPHNPVHDLVGGIFDTMQSPIDVIFWLHHANIDRLWSAWAAAGGGRAQPPAGDAYWNGTFTYAPKLSLPVSSTVDTRLNLGYYYENEILPTVQPGGVVAAPTTMVGGADSMVMRLEAQLPRQPALGSFGSTPMRTTGANSVSLGGATGIALERASVSARVTLDRAGHQALQEMLASYQTSPFTIAKSASTPFTAAKVVLSGVKLTSVGAGGGYYYNLYLNLPNTPVTADVERKFMFGNLGPFRVKVSMHHDRANPKGTRIEFDVTELLLANRSLDLSVQTFSFVRISGDNAPDGDVITIGECRLELT
jgi:tyrosinase